MMGPVSVLTGRGFNNGCREKKKKNEGIPHKSCVVCSTNTIRLTIPLGVLGRGGEDT